MIIASKRIIEIWVKILDGAKICIKYSKHEHYSFPPTIDCRHFAYFDPEKAHLKKNCLTLMLINFYVQMLQTETQILNLFCS